MLRVVLDANVYVSALIRPQGPPGQIIMRFLENSFEIVLSPAIVEETVRAFSYPKVRKYIHAGVDPELWFEDGFYWLSSSLVTTSSRASA